MRLSRTTKGELLPRGMLAGIGGTVVMTGFQKLVEMPLTKRAESFAPADLVERVTPIHPETHEGRRRLNYATHFGLGLMWGSAYALAFAKGLRGQRAVNTVFAVVYSGDVALNTALRLYHPTQWTVKDWTIDLVDKFVQAQGTGVIFEKVLQPTR